MSIKLRFEKGSLVTQVVLKDTALAPLLALLSEHQSDEPLAVATLPSAGFALTQSTEASTSVKEWVRQRTATELLNQIKWSSNPEKILLLAAFHESVTKDEVWRSADIEARFSDARETFPGNFPRDIKTAIKDGMIAAVTARTYRVSRTGWNRIRDTIEKLSSVAPL